jgi:NAD(P)-dependent dehydrogenase (short-subunit alcohol dehydrogenase family)
MTQPGAGSVSGAWRLRDRVCLVTGATGIAAAAARRFGAEGAMVFVVARTEANARALADEIRGAGGRSGYGAADLTDPEAAAGAVEACVAFGGRLDALFAVAGGSGRRYGDGPAADASIEGWQSTFEQNALPAFLTLREGLRAMRTQAPNASGTRGAVLLMSSVLAVSPSPRLFPTHAYAAAKGAIATLARTTAAYYAPEGIRINAIAPALVMTPMSQRAADDPATLAYVARKQPLAGGFMPPEDVAAAAAYLVSDEARFVTGQLLILDAGWSVTEVEPQPGAAMEIEA